MTTPTFERVEVGGQILEASETTTLTRPLSAREIGQAISAVVASGDRGFAIDLVTALQVRTRLAQDTGERVMLAEFAAREGFDLDQLRAE